ncbi:uncharacterized protein PADG_05090 [Paracoccidioides brasiliensis Pb18]|uniref:Uncharacterized protein n=2 Tax=Paracoccidioides brasiliensis TaxID=121759 RepID=C1GBT9_PARBD|nr:uncharacterized protein PADG_05090 [Paracoccidioides brasiliensis Pb18]EEH49011.1 hypothetical protein PADG_05090 [Paracoccidioides brasiliensis Pb18]ODH14672.1 hypothetical protein ACO22_06530 [Paracoccidioides brasiliensis]ODH45733.1 hypothetical protein GX48_08178 [Paracoccidioides brasiliensis]
MPRRTQPTLSNVVELEVKKRELDELQVHQIELVKFIKALRQWHQQVEQLTTSGRYAFGIQSDEQRGLTHDEGIAHYEEELVNIGSRISTVESSIELLSQP